MNALADTQDNVDASGGASAPAANVDTPASSPAASPAATPTAAPSAQPAADDRKAPRSRAEAAAARVAARQSANDSAPADAADGQTGGDADSTQPAADAGAADPDTSKAGAAAETPADSTLQAPQDWPRAWVEKFNAAPGDDARQWFLDVYGDMNAGLQKAFQTIDQQRKGNEALFGAMTELGIGPDEVEKAARLYVSADDDPVGTVETVMEKLGVTIDQLSAEQPPPEFADAAALAKWASDKARRDLERQMRAERQREDAERQKAQVNERFQRELKEAGAKYGDLQQQWPAVVETLTAHPLLSIEQAYKLARYDALAQQVGTVDALRAEVATLKAAEEARRKAATQPPGRGGNGREAPPPKVMSRGEAAMARAERRLAARGAA